MCAKTPKQSSFKYRIANSTMHLGQHNISTTREALESSAL
jgi:hypothetical protein